MITRENVPSAKKANAILPPVEELKQTILDLLGESQKPEVNVDDLDDQTAGRLDMSDLTTYQQEYLAGRLSAARWQLFNERKKSLVGVRAIKLSRLPGSKQPPLAN